MGMELGGWMLDFFLLFFVLFWGGGEGEGGRRGFKVDTYIHQAGRYKPS